MIDGSGCSIWNGDRGDIHVYPLLLYVTWVTGYVIVPSMG
jgi:hypothetical protein